MVFGEKLGINGLLRVINSYVYGVIYNTEQQQRWLRWVKLGIEPGLGSETIILIYLPKAKNLNFVLFSFKSITYMFTFCAIVLGNGYTFFSFEK